MSRDVQSEGSKALDQVEHSSDASAKRVILRYQDSQTGSWYNYNPNGGDSISRYDYTDSSTIYVGNAARGTISSDQGWTITKYDLSDSSDASGLIATNVSWADRAVGTYV
jgi:hypothetical protein